MAKAKTNGWGPTRKLLVTALVSSFLGFCGWVAAKVDAHTSLVGHPVIVERVGNISDKLDAITKGVSANHEALIRIEAKQEGR